MTEVGTTTLRHNPLNAVTANVERITYADGRTAVRKELRRPAGSTDPRAAPWAASTDPRHWNYWRRELEVYRDDELRAQLADTGLVLPEAQVDEGPDGAVLLMEDISGTPGTHFSLAEHAALARACGRWQARPAAERPWTSHGFLREYSTTRDVPWQLMTDAAAWQQPLIRETWPPRLREAWTRLLVHRDALLDLVAALPRARCHLDFWVSNVIQRPSGEVALFDWAFYGDGALGEDCPACSGGRPTRRTTRTTARSTAATCSTSAGRPCCTSPTGASRRSTAPGSGQETRSSRATPIAASAMP
ncbi:hypothetical protein [Kribbella sp. HUAS MG21]|uniref:Aminoglycoside phosphotransferase domain-containing protein n=1 Tax=Kribbella sp. HUAS MG21 TaxID=3160966 RepID=A0AAU7TFV3_9ACTN